MHSLVSPKSKWIVHLEDDWFFRKPSTIERSLWAFHQVTYEKRDAYGKLEVRETTDSFQRFEPISEIICWEKRMETKTLFLPKGLSSDKKDWTWGYYEHYLNVKHGYGHFTFNAGLHPKWIWEYFGPFFNETQGKQNSEMMISMKMEKYLSVGVLKPGTCIHGGDGKRARDNGPLTSPWDSKEHKK